MQKLSDLNTNYLKSTTQLVNKSAKEILSVDGMSQSSFVHVDQLNQTFNKPLNEYDIKQIQLEALKYSIKFEPTLENDKILWLSVGKVEKQDVQNLICFSHYLGRSLHINTGTHCNKNGKIVGVNRLELASERPINEDIQLKAPQGRISIHTVSTYSGPINPENIDVVYAWCYSKNYNEVKDDGQSITTAQEICDSLQFDEEIPEHIIRDIIPQLENSSLRIEKLKYALRRKKFRLLKVLIQIQYHQDFQDALWDDIHNCIQTIGPVTVLNKFHQGSKIYNKQIVSIIRAEAFISTKEYPEAVKAFSEVEMENINTEKLINRLELIKKEYILQSKQLIDKNNKTEFEQSKGFDRLNNFNVFQKLQTQTNDYYQNITNLNFNNEISLESTLSSVYKNEEEKLPEVEKDQYLECQKMFRQIMDLDYLIQGEEEYQKNLFEEGIQQISKAIQNQHLNFQFLKQRLFFGLFKMLDLVKTVNLEDKVLECIFVRIKGLKLVQFNNEERTSLLDLLKMSPSEIFSLEFQIYSFNYYTMVVLIYIISKFSNLQKLELSFKIGEQIDISVIQIRWVCQLLQNFKINEIKFNFALHSFAKNGLIQMEESLKNKKNLIHLNFSKTSKEISGKEYIYFGKIISQLQQIESFQLELPHQVLRDESIESISQGLQNLSNLRHLELNLSNNPLKNIVFQIFESISKLHKLKDLSINFEHSGINPEVTKEISQYIKNWIGLIKFKLYLSHNAVDEVGFKSVCGAINELTSIKQLHLSFESALIPSEGLKYLELAISQMKNLEILKLNFINNQIKTEHIKSLMNSINQLKKLNDLFLILSYNNIQSQEFCNKIIPHPNLLSLKIVLSNKINIGVTEFCNFISGLGNLKSLDLNFWCKMSKKDEVVLVTKASSSLKNLTNFYLTLQYQRINSQEMQCICQSISPFQKLKRLQLYLTQNKIQSRGVEHISTFISSLSQLEWLELSVQYNEIDSQGPFYISQFLQMLKSLKHLRLILSVNNLKDSITHIGESLQYLENLQYLSIIAANCHIEESSAITLGEKIQNLNNLLEVQVALNKNDFQFSTIKQFNDIISGMKNIQKHDLIFGQEYQEPYLKLIQKIESAFFMEWVQLDFEFQQISKKLAQKIRANCESLDIKHISLTTLNQNIDLDSIDEIFKGLVKIPKLESLRLNQGFLTIDRQYGSKVFELIQTLQNLTFLHLNFSSTRINKQGFELVLNSFASLNQLKKLKLVLKNNQLNTNDFKQILKSIESLPSLQKLKLDLSKNFITFEDCVIDEFNFFSLPKLHHLALKLEKNKIKAQGMLVLSGILSKLSYLKLINLKLPHNQIESAGVYHIGQTIQKLDQLRSIRIHLYENGVNKKEEDYLKDLVSKQKEVLNWSIRC